MNISIQGFHPVDGGVCAAKGFSASGVHCGLRKKDQPDLALLRADAPSAAAAVYTQNKVKGAPLTVTKAHLCDHMAEAVIINSGNANTCNLDGEEKAERMCVAAADALKIDAQNVLVASTGVIGEPLPVELIEKACPALVKGLSREGHHDASKAIMTTDTCQKEYAVSFPIGTHTGVIGGMAKGSGMIHPNMATMLCFLTTDVSIDGELLQLALSAVVRDTFNMVSVDGDTSTNDMVLLLSSGQAGNETISDPDSDAFQDFVSGLYTVMMNLSRMIAKDGEGATKLLTCSVSGAKDEATAKIVAKSVITSNLFKCAMFGEDANWGRILCAVGYADADVSVDGVAVSISSQNGDICVCQNGRGVPFSEKDAKHILEADEIEILISLSDGNGKAVAWGCDLTTNYVKINADYRS